MRTAGAVLLVALSASANAGDARPPLPAYDIDATCRTQANYSFAATLGDSSFERIFVACQANERDARDATTSLWGVSPAAVLTECIELAEGRYTHLARCLDGSGMRTAR